MKDSQILSTFGGASVESTSSPTAPAMPMVFDACHIGVMLRALLFVETVLGVAVLYRADDFLSWVAGLGLLTVAGLPGTLAWLAMACCLKRPLARLSTPGQYVAGAVLGALAGSYGCFMLSLSPFAPSPPWLAAAMTGALLAGLLVGALVLRARGRTPAATTARLAELQSRIRPHFLFNTLNSAIALVRAEPARAETLLEDLSDLFRAALLDRGETTTLAQEVQLARHYLAIEQVRFGDRLRVQWQIDPAADAARLPPLLLQPLVENAIKHGVEPSTEGGEVQVRTRLKGDRVRIDILNTLPNATLPFETRSAGHGIALANVRDRLRLLHDVEIEFSAGVRDDHYHVRITFPA
ncbi:histidine kinase [Curvibacter sp. RS43]|uniref:Histidine kinase n=1 Tax=Curvibacter microcysteis TaxID=3026419 RepID=A0ABT5MGA7_9BURK|nr:MULTISPECIES: histidine kinase [unclassified Curvibacter]MDD0810649.1 histidine kinase [Curvibacter sp. RS43]MDD0815613.1 histidine kinase [Curvibacter sp. HBC28]